MAEPKKRLTSTRSGNRRSHLNIDRPAVAICPNCKSTVKPHTLCQKCGYYKGKQILLVNKTK